MKYALDTSVLVRILSNRPQPLAGEVIRLVAERIGGRDTMAVSNLVLSEAYYAMQHHYGVDKESVLKALRIITLQPGFEFSPEAEEALAVENLAHTNPGFVDRLICVEQERLGIKVLSCEKSFRQLPNAETIP